MKVWRKFTAVAFALVMMLALSAVALADGEATLSGGVAKDGTTPYAYAAISNTLHITKTITVHGSGTKVYGPTVTYAYNIAGTETSATIDDGTNSGPVRKGPDDGVTIGSAVFTSGEVMLSSGTYDVEVNIPVTVDPSKFTAPGVYRYTITEAADNENALIAAGITRSAAAATYYLDVYVKNAASGFEVYGYVLLNANESITTANATNYKTDAFLTDHYYTMDITVTKTVTGNAGDKTHQFPFTITVSNSNLNFYSGKTTANATAAATTNLSTSLADSESFVIVGLNPKATVTYVETNDTIDVYTTTINKSDDTQIVAAAPVSANTGTASSGVYAVSNYDTINSGSTASTSAPTVALGVKFINNLDAISPTGVVLRYAPYFAMMGAGVVALPLTIRRRREDF